MGCLKSCGIFALVLSALFAYLVQIGRQTFLVGTIPLLVNEDVFSDKDIPSLRGKIIIVTGANTGLGKSSVKFLALNGAKVIMACRSMKRCDQAKLDIIGEIQELKSDDEKRKIQMLFDKENLVPMELDLGSLSSINKFANKFQAQNKHLHSLLLNAGTMNNDYTLTTDGIEVQFGVNHVGHFYLTKLLLPTLLISQPSTIVSVSSMAHFMPYKEGIKLPEKIVKGKGAEILLKHINNVTDYDKMAAYGQSKLANVLFAAELSEQMQTKGYKVFVNAVHPGAVKTELSRHMPFMEIVWPLVKAVSGILYFESDVAAFTQLYAAVGENIVKNTITGKYFVPLGEVVPASDYGRDKSLQKKLWTFTDELIRELGYA